MYILFNYTHSLFLRSTTMYLKFCKLDEQIAWTSERSGVVDLLKRPNQRLPESLAAGLRARRRGGAAARGTELDDVAHRGRGATRERLEARALHWAGAWWCRGAIGTRDVPTRCQCTPRVRVRALVSFPRLASAVRVRADPQPHAVLAGRLPACPCPAPDRTALPMPPAGPKRCADASKTGLFVHFSPSKNWPEKS